MELYTENLIELVNKKVITIFDTEEIEKKHFEKLIIACHSSFKTVNTRKLETCEKYIRDSITYIKNNLDFCLVRKSDNAFFMGLYSDILNNEFPEAIRALDGYFLALIEDVVMKSFFNINDIYDYKFENLQFEVELD